MVCGFVFPCVVVIAFILLHIHSQFFNVVLDLLIIIIIIIIIIILPPVVKIPGVKNTELKTKSGVAASPCRLDEENCLWTRWRCSAEWIKTAAGRGRRFHAGHLKLRYVGSQVQKWSQWRMHSSAREIQTPGAGNWKYSVKRSTSVLYAQLLVRRHHPDWFIIIIIAWSVNPLW